MQKLVKTFALIGILSVTVWLGSIREAHAFPACWDIQGASPCYYDPHGGEAAGEGETMICETYSQPASKVCTCENGTWVCRSLIPPG